MPELASDSPADTNELQGTTREDPAEIEATEVETAEEEIAEAFPLDQVFGILKNSRRRLVLEYVADTDGQVSLSEVAEQIAAWENDKDVKQITSSERKRVYVGLYQCHLPKMDSVGIISFDKARGTIEVQDGVERFYDYLDTDEESDARPWHAYSVLMSLLGAAILGAAMLLRPMTVLPVVDLAVVAVILSFIVYAAGSLRWQRAAREDGDA